jgi:hypothetical protein
MLPLVMKIENLELLLVILIVFIQVLVFVHTFKRIIVFKRLIPAKSFLTIILLKIPIQDLTNLEPAEILNNIKKYKELDSNHKERVRNIPESELVEGLLDNNIFIMPSSGEESDTSGNGEYSQGGNDEYGEVNVLECTGFPGFEFKEILTSLNTYMIRNRGAAMDFNLIKDIVERNSDAIEEDINITMPIPLYLGLMGTMIGIVIGLFNMSNLANSSTQTDDFMGQNISILLSGVKIAMIASFTGLLLTVINSGWFFKGSKSFIEKKKNGLYTLIQTELLPVINQSLAGTLLSLQRNLLLFNNEFSSNLNRLTGLFHTNYDALVLQDKVMTDLAKLDISQVAKFNIKVLQELKQATEEFEKFNQYLGRMNEFAKNSRMLTSQVNELLERTNNFGAIATNLDGRLNESQQLMEFLRDHFSELQDRRYVLRDVVVKVDEAINTAISQLKEHTSNSIQQVKDFTIAEASALQEAMSDNKRGFGNLEFLEQISKDLKEFKLTTSTRGQEISQEFQLANKSINQVKVSVKEINDRKSVYIRVWERIKKIR